MMGYWAVLIHIPGNDINTVRLAETKISATHALADWVRDRWSQLPDRPAMPTDPAKVIERWFSDPTNHDYCWEFKPVTPRK